MNIIFFGDDQFSVTAFDIVYKFCQTSTSHQISLVVTHRPKPEGRGLKLTPSPVEKFAREHRIKVSYYSKDNDSLSNIIELTKNAQTDLGLIASFGYILPLELIKVFPKGLLNIHPSLLPQYRNVTPVQHALALGDKKTGVTVFTITPQIDSGKILAQKQESIKPEDTNTTLSHRLFQQGATMAIDLIKRDLKPETSFTPYPPSLPLIFTKRFTRESGFIEWPVFLKIVSNEPIQLTDTSNQLLQLRIQKDFPVTHTLENPQEAANDLTRALEPWPRVWTTAITKKGELRLLVTSVRPKITVQLAGKPTAISWEQFQEYYL